VNSVHVHEAAVTMSMVDGDVLTPMQMSRIVAAVITELRRNDDKQRSRERDTRVAASRLPGHDGERSS
jgi:hypothetical protein